MMGEFKRVDRGANERTNAVMERMGMAVPDEANSLVGSVDPFDPGKHTAKDVLAHLTDHAADEAEVARVLAAEADGGARKSVLAFEVAPADAD